MQNFYIKWLFFSFTWNPSFFTSVLSAPLNKSSCTFLIPHCRSYCIPYSQRPSWFESSLPSTFPVAKEFSLNFFVTRFENLSQVFQFLFTSNFWRFCIICLHYTVSKPQAINLDTRSMAPASQTSAFIEVPSCLRDTIAVMNHHDLKQPRKQRIYFAYRST